MVSVEGRYYTLADSNRKVRVTCNFDGIFFSVLRCAVHGLFIFSDDTLNIIVYVRIGIGTI
jgi:hypothetical protein